MDIYNSLLFRKNEISNFSTLDMSKFQGEIINVNKKGKIKIKQSNQQFFRHSENQIKLII